MTWPDGYAGLAELRLNDLAVAEARRQVGAESLIARGDVDIGKRSTIYALAGRARP